MKIYEILDTELKISVGVLLYYEKIGSCIIELKDDLDEWTAPLLFTGYVRKEIYTIPKDISELWVKERVIPSGRQNIGSILSNHKLTAYDEMKFLEISNGRCSQDNLCIRKRDSLPEYVLKRMEKNITECFLSGKDDLLCFFADGSVKKINLLTMKQLLAETEENSGDNMTGNAVGKSIIISSEQGYQRIYHPEELIDQINKILKNPKLLESAEVGVGGYSVNFGGSIDIPSYIFYETDMDIPFTADDFQSFVRKNVLDTTDSCEILECSRQNLAYIQKKQLKPVKENVKGNLYLKGDILRNSW